MTPVRWLLIRSERELAACFAETRADAETALGPIPVGGYVTSEASWRVGLPRAVRLALERPALCVKCGLRPIGGTYATKRLCPKCGAGEQARYREARREQHARTLTHPAKARVITGRQQQAVREASIRRGVAQRAAKRQASEG